MWSERTRKWMSLAAALLYDGKELFAQRFGKVIPSLARTEIIAIYRSILDVDPADAAEIDACRNEYTAISQLRWQLLASDDYRARNPPIHVPTLNGDEPAIPIEEVESDAQLQTLLTHVQEAWQHLGEIEPYWSVVAGEDYRMAKIEQTREQFYRTGKPYVERVKLTLARNGIPMETLRTCLEYGCGLGRVTRWLAPHFEQLYAYDISLPHLHSIEQYLHEIGQDNVVVNHIQSPDDLNNLPKVDLVYSIMVLQHNPPPVITLIIERLLQALNAGGYAYFQVPTYRLDYRFQLADYLDNEGKRQEMEMHLLPQSEIFALIQRNGAQVVEVLEDSHTGLRYKERSNTFLARKLTADPLLL